MIAETKNAIASGFNRCRTGRVQLLRGFRKMLTAVELDNEARRMTHEIGNVVRYWHLAPKAGSHQAVAAQLRPKNPLDISTVPAE
jgi:hypothetical protein